MSESRYQVVFTGALRPGFTQEQVVQNLTEKLKLSKTIADSLFDSSRAVIKRDLDFALARKYEQRFFLQGMIIKPELMESKFSSGVTVNSDSDELVGEIEPVKAKADLTLVDSESKKNESSSTSSSKIAPPISSVETDTATASSSTDLSEDSTETDAAYPKVLAFEFNGNGKEYFKIWIVNIVLTILTLGIYSAWAKVRNKQYFYGNTLLDGASFEYTAQPIQILKGRLLAFAVVGIYYFGGNFLPPLYQAIFYGAALVLFVIIFPWVVVKGLQFNARHSNYRNINFGFDGSYWGAFKAFILWPIAGITVFLLPYSWHRKNHFFVDNSRYGTESFQFSATVSDYYRLFGMMIALGVGLSVAAFIVTLIGGFLATLSPVLSTIVIGLVYAAVYFILFAYFASANNNLLYNSTILKQHNLTSDYDLKSYLLMLFKNTLCILTVFGIPWALVRTARYHAEKTSFIAAEDLNNFIAAEEQHVNTLAEGLADTHDMFDIGVGI